MIWGFKISPLLAKTVAACSICREETDTSWPKVIVGLLRADQRAGREARRKQVELVETLVELALHAAHDVHHVAVALDCPVRIDVHGAGTCHPAEIVAREVDEHHVFGLLLLVAKKVLGQGVVAHDRHRKPKHGVAVLGHEVSHVANGDMVTMGLLQGVVNTFVIFFSRIIGHVVDRVVFKTERGYGPAYFITSIVAQIFLSIIASTIVMWFSRRREFRADAGGADLAGRQKMISALQRLAGVKEPQDLPGEFAAFGISGRFTKGLGRLFLSHPPLEERIAALEAQR